MSKKLIHAIAYDIFNWSLHISVVVFLWSLSHYYAILLGGLFTLRWFSNFLYLREFYKEQQNISNKVMKELVSFQEKLKQTEALRPKPELVENNVVEFKSPNDKDILQ